MITGFILIAACILNRVRGAGGILKKIGLPGRALYYVSAIMGLMTWAFYGALEGLVIAVCYFIWGVGPWGRWFDLHRMDHIPRKAASKFEKAVEKICFGSDHLCFFVRQLAVFPVFIYLYYASGWNEWLLLGPFIFSAFVTAIYECCWGIDNRYAIPSAELFTGYLWGFIIILVGTV